jgi:dihydrolipoamide dehydrogenase
VKLDLAQMMKRKEAVVRQLVNGIAGLLKKNKVEGISGLGRFMPSEGDQRRVEVETASGKRLLEAPKVLIATGSEPSSLPFMPFDGKTVLSSTEALELTEVPKHLVVIGGGVIGLEMGSVWLRLGAKVTVVEFQDRICPGVDQQVGKELFKALQKQGMNFRLATKCMGAEKNINWMVVQLEELSTGNKSQLECDKILVATGRRPYTAGLGLENVGLSVDKLGRVSVDAHYQTATQGIYAVGDVIESRCGLR